LASIVDAKGNGRKEQDTLNFSAGINKGNLSLTLWGKNITDDEYLDIGLSGCGRSNFNIIFWLP
jgi:outer membrane receptor protein involved in Fe transport